MYRYVSKEKITLEIDFRKLTEETMSLSSEFRVGEGLSFDKKKKLMNSYICQVNSISHKDFFKIKIGEHVLDVPCDWLILNQLLVSKNDSHFFLPIFSRILNEEVKMIYVQDSILTFWKETLHELEVKELLSVSDNQSFHFPKAA